MGFRYRKGRLTFRTNVGRLSGKYVYKTCSRCGRRNGTTFKLCSNCRKYLRKH